MVCYRSIDVGILFLVFGPPHSGRQFQLKTVVWSVEGSVDFFYQFIDGFSRGVDNFLD